MERRTFVMGLGSAAVGGSALVGSGAFSSVEAERTVEVETADDADAFLGLSTDSPYANEDGGTLELTFSSEADTEDGDGLPPRANTEITDAFEIENNGTEDVFVYIPGTDNTAVASTQFLVDADESTSPNVSGSEPGEDPAVDRVDISWDPENDVTSVEDKPSRPIPETGEGENGFAGLRYPGGALELGSGESESVDVRFTVSNERDKLDDRLNEPFFIVAEDEEPDTTDWDIS